MIRMAFCVATALLVSNLAVAGSDLNSASWLAWRSAPTCPTRPGVRSSRSDLVRFGDMSASISAQGARDENGGCEQSASVWVTKGGVSQEFGLPNAMAETFSIVDFAPDGSSILLYREKMFALPGEDAAPQVALLSTGGAAPQWEPLGRLINRPNCANAAEPEGFLQARKLVFRVTSTAPGGRATVGCEDKPGLLAVDLDSRKVYEAPASTFVRHSGKRVAGPIFSCESDPDTVGACYTMRGRLGLAPSGPSMRIWQVGTTKTFDLVEGMLPDELSSQVIGGNRIYADMVVCPLVPKPRPTVCIESAANSHVEALSPSQLAKTPVKGVIVEQGTSH